MHSSWLIILALALTLALAAQNVVADELPAQLKPAADHYAQERKTLDENRAKQADALRARYHAALTAAHAGAAKANKQGPLVAIEAEMKDLKSELFSPTMPADLPRALSAPRRDFVAGLAALDKSATARTSEINARYLQALRPFEQLAAQQKDAVLAEAVAAEKARVLPAAGIAAAPALRKNVIENGDFSIVEPTGLPKGWQPKGESYQGSSLPWQDDAIIIQEGSEKFLRFRRKVGVRLANLAPSSVITVPARAKAVKVSLRARVEGLVPGNGYHQYPGVALKAFDATGKSPGAEWAVAKENTRWRTLTAKLPLQAGAKTLEVSVGPWGAAGICDFDDVEVEFE